MRSLGVGTAFIVGMCFFVRLDGSRAMWRWRTLSNVRCMLLGMAILTLIVRPQLPFHSYRMECGCTVSRGLAWKSEERCNGARVGFCDLMRTKERGWPLAVEGHHFIHVCSQIAFSCYGFSVGGFGPGLYPFE